MDFDMDNGIDPKYARGGTDLIYRVKAPSIGYSLQRRPKREEIYPTLTALMQAHSTPHFIFNPHSEFGSGTLGRNLRRILLRDSSLKTLIAFRPSIGDRFLFPVAMANNRYVERLVFPPQTKFCAYLDSLGSIPAEQLHPLHVLSIQEVNPTKNICGGLKPLLGTY